MCLKRGTGVLQKTPQGSQENLLRRIGFKDLIELSKKFCFLVSSHPGWEAAFSDVIKFQCNCLVFWSRCAYEHVLFLGLHLKIDDDGIVSALAQYLHVPLPHQLYFLSICLAK